MRPLLYRLIILFSFMSAFATQSYANDSDLVACNRNFKVVILGSSTAFGTGASTYDSSWAGKFTAYLQRRNPLNQVINLGIPGLTTYENLCPIGFVPPPGRPSPVSGFTITDALALDPDAIIINMPSNDALNDYTQAEQQANFERTMALADAANVPVWVATTQPRNFSDPNRIANIQAMRTWILSRFAEKAIEFYDGIANPDGTINVLYNFDGVHLNNRGHDTLYTRVRAETIIDSLCNRFNQQELVARAGNDQFITLPLNSVTLDGSASSSLNGTITQYSWNKIAGPASFLFANPNAATTLLSNLTEGRYAFALTVTDNNNLSRSDTMQVVVSSRVLIDFGPTATTSPDAGNKYWNNISDGLPGVKLSSTVTIANTASPIGLEVISRIDGTFNTAGPGTNTGNTTGDVGDYPASSTTDFAFAHPSTTTGQWKLTGLDPLKQYVVKFWGSRTGITDARIIEIKRADQATWQEYNATENTSFSNAALFQFSNKSEAIFDIRVKDGSVFGYIDLIDISYATAPAEGNLAPVARAGNNQVVTLPNTSTTLDGSASSDEDGSIDSYAWSKLTGPANFNISNPNSATTQVTGLELGVYTFELKVTDNEGAENRDTITVTVNSRILFDFGPTSTVNPDLNGNYWNNIANGLPGVKVTNAISTGNAATTVSLEIINRIDGTFNPAGPGTNTGNTVGDVQDYLAAATTDYAFAHPSATNGLWKIAGLDPAREYTIKFWGNRSPVTDPRIIEIKRTDETNWTSYDGANNSNYNQAAVFVVNAVSELSFDIRVASGSPFGYISVVDIQETNAILPCSPAVNIVSSASFPVCVGTLVTFTATPVNGGSTPQYQWKRNAVNIDGANADVYQTDSLQNGDQISCEMISNLVCLGSNTASSNVITAAVLPVPATPGRISGPTNVCDLVGTPTEATYSVAPVPNATEYTWEVPAGVIIVSGQGTQSIQVTFPFSYPSVDSIKVFAGPCSNGIPSKLAVFKRQPNSPGAVTGPTNVCAFIGQGISVSYSIDPVPNATSYIWTLPSNTVIVTGQGTTNLEVQYLNGFTSGTLTVSALSNCGSRTPRSVSISGAKPGQPSAITGPVEVCAFVGTATVVDYSISPVANAQSYFWTVPTGITILNGQGTTTIQVLFESTYAGGNIRVRSEAPCGNSGDRTLVLSTGSFGTPGAIAGPTNACPLINSGTLATYSIQPVQGASSYIWEVPAGATIINRPGANGPNDTLIDVQFDDNFINATSITVQAAGCGISAPRALVINRSGVPATPGAITGPTNSCDFTNSTVNAFYSIRKVTNASFYEWQVPAGATLVSHPAGLGVNDTIIEVAYDLSFVSGNVSVRSANGCGSNNVFRNLFVRKAATPATPVISGPTNPCDFIGVGTATYTIRKVANATGYTWTVPAVGASAVHPNAPGVDDTVIVVTFTSDFTTGAITAQANSTCGNSSVRSFTLTRRLASIPGTISVQTLTACPAREIQYSIAALPSNATATFWSVPDGASIVSGQGTLSILVSYPPNAITGTVRVWGSNNCGLGSSSRNISVNLPACTLVKPTPEFTKVKPVLEAGNGFDMQTAPNPSASYFTLTLKSDKPGLATLRVYDLNGRVLETRSSVYPNQPIRIGDSWKPGIYMAELILGTGRKQVKLLKQ